MADVNGRAAKRSWQAREARSYLRRAELYRFLAGLYGSADDPPSGVGVWGIREVHWPDHSRIHGSLWRLYAFYGLLSDRLGRQRIMIFSLSAFLLLTLRTATAQTAG